MEIIATRQLDIAASIDSKQLKQQLRPLLKQMPRRVDRLTWQCLLVAAPLRPHLQPDCGLYLASYYPSRDTMGSLLHSVCIDRLQPKPFEFVNSVSNAAGFYLARQLELDGPNLCLGSHEHIWPQLLQLAHCDLANGQIQQALMLNCLEDPAGNTTLQVLLVRGEADCAPLQWSGHENFTAPFSKGDVNEI